MSYSEMLWRLIDEISTLLDGLNNQVLKKVVIEVVQPMSSDSALSFLLCDSFIPNNFLASLPGPLLLFTSLTLSEILDLLPFLI